MIIILWYKHFQKTLKSQRNNTYGYTLYNNKVPSSPVSRKSFMMIIISWKHHIPSHIIALYYNYIVKGEYSYCCCITILQHTTSRPIWRVTLFPLEFTILAPLFLFLWLVSELSDINTKSNIYIYIYSYYVHKRRNSEDGICALVTHTAIYTILYSRERPTERERQERREKTDKRNKRIGSHKGKH